MDEIMFVDAMDHHNVIGLTKRNEQLGQIHTWINFIINE
jgi:hypothetical protein